ncbi:hypothetical protein DAEQUDRAFT_42238 [Daedalea quercina L-15889]|uniref:Uncharacterized protein n=1 Tax=Daedalea quercina L-15889 TaxID=1314783 RepID=A0A165LEA2_9APHY|nr:hypothetical protein DAEQUDRAFT_42238 [Daedalea quercina L-15889]
MGSDFIPASVCSQPSRLLGTCCCFHVISRTGGLRHVLRYNFSGRSCALSFCCTIANVPPHISAASQITLTARGADVIILLVTWRKTYHTMKLARNINISAPLSALLLRDGTTYFGALNAALYFTEVFVGFSYFRLSFTSIILSRFFLNLRNASILDASTSSSRTTQLQSDIQFSRGASSLGGPLALGGEDIYERDVGGEIYEGEALADEGEGRMCEITEEDRGGGVVSSL